VTCRAILLSVGVLLTVVAVAGAAARRGTDRDSGLWILEDTDLAP